MAVTITITDAGRAALTDAENTGTDPVTISEVGIGNGSYTAAPDATATALKAEIKRLTTIAGEVVADDTIHVIIKDEGNDTYDVTEFGLYLADGTLFAIYAVTSGVIMQKAAASSMLLASDIIFTTINATSLTFGDTSFTNPPASETVKGVVELATATETQEGADGTRAVTPAGLSARSATETRTGLAEVATQTETDAGTDDSRIVTPKKLAEKIKQATESVLGLLKVATQAQTDAGTDDATAVTPKKLCFGFSYSLTDNGYIIFPTWLGGFIWQWIRGAAHNGLNEVSLPIAFPTSGYFAIASDGGTAQASISVDSTPFNTSGTAIRVNASTSTATLFYAIAIGR